jgi:hypothetical protein
VLPPSAIIWTPTAWLSSSRSRPARIAQAMAGGASSRRKERTATATVSSTSTETRAPIAENTAPSNAVDSLKCDGTPRQRCIETRKTSATEAAAKVPTSTQAVPRRGRRKDRNQVMVASVMPNESPKTIGLRHDTGPSQEPPATRKTPAWNAALASSRAAQP